MGRHVARSSSDERKPFKPSNPMKTGEPGYISKFIRLEPKEGAKKPVRKRHEKKEGEEERKAFK